MSDGYITLSKAAQRTPGRPTPGTVWRWCRRGVTSRNENTIRLQHIRAGGRVFTTDQWLQEFFAELAKADLMRWQHRKQRPTAERHSDADKKLQEAGL